VPAARRGEVVEIRAMVGHPMETGHRPDGQGRTVARDILTRFECRFDGQLVFAADLYPAVAANPYLSFMLRAERSGTLQFRWLGDRGFEHTESKPLSVA
jgi:sulfur-oxidizing protein SoxZ